MTRTIERVLSTGTVAAVLIVCLAFAAPLPAQGGSEPTTPPPGDGSDVYQRDQDVLDKASELYKNTRGAGSESLADSARTYDPEGRRDPFRPLIGGAQAEDDMRGQLPGIAGLLFEEVKLVGIVESDEGAPVAVFFGGPNEEGYFVREGMNFFNGSVHQISTLTNSVVIRQRVDDPIRPYRDIDILLYPHEDE
jgi:hypothetical protein